MNIVILPIIATTITKQTTGGRAKIDLSKAESWLLRPALVAFGKDAISREPTTVVRNILKFSHHGIQV